MNDAALTVGLHDQASDCKSCLNGKYLDDVGGNHEQYFIKTSGLCINIKNDQCRLGTFDNAKDGAIAYDRAVLKHNRSTTLLNFPGMKHNLEVEPKRKKYKAIFSINNFPLNWPLSFPIDLIAPEIDVVYQEPGKESIVVATAHLKVEWTMLMLSIGITENAGAVVTQGSSKGILKTALQNEWTLGIQPQVNNNNIRGVAGKAVVPYSTDSSMAVSTTTTNVLTSALTLQRQMADHDSNTSSTILCPKPYPHIVILQLSITTRIKTSSQVHGMCIMSMDII